MKKLFSYQLSVTSKQVLLFTFHCLLFTVYCLLFTACDYVSNPLLPKSGGVINATNAIKASDSTGTLTNFLVEDYTGEYCENCPSAASALDNLIASHGNLSLIHI